MVNLIMKPKEENPSLNNDDMSDNDADDLSDDTDSDSEGFTDADLLASACQDEVTAQLAAAGPVGMAAAAAIATAKKRKRPHTFETNPSIRKRQQTRLLRKLKATIDEYTTRVGQQAVVVIGTPGKPQNNFKVFGARPLENVVRNLRGVVMQDLETALALQAPVQVKEDPSLHELPPLVVDGIPTPVEKMTQAQLRAFIPLMLKYSTGRGKPGWGKESTRPPWWPKDLPWANVRSDARTEDEKQKVSWTHALRQIVINCYKFHGREDLLPAFTEDDEKNAAAGGSGSMISAGTNALGQVVLGPGGMVSSLPMGITLQQQASSGMGKEKVKRMSQHTLNTSTASVIGNATGGIINLGGGNYACATSLAGALGAQGVTMGTIQGLTGQPGQTITMSGLPASVMGSLSQSDLAQAGVNNIYAQAIPAFSPAMFQTITNPDGTMSIVQMDPNSTLITLPDGTQAQVRTVSALRLQNSGPDTQAVQTLAEIATQGDNERVSGLNTVNVDLGDGNTQAVATLAEATIGPDGQIILTGEDGTQSTFPVSGMVTIPVSMYQTVVTNIQNLTEAGIPISVGAVTQAAAAAAQGGQQSQTSLGGNQPTMTTMSAIPVSIATAGGGFTQAIMGNHMISSSSTSSAVTPMTIPIAQHNQSKGSSQQQQGGGEPMDTSGSGPVVVTGNGTLGSVTTVSMTPGGAVLLQREPVNQSSAQSQADSNTTNSNNQDIKVSHLVNGGGSYGNGASTTSTSSTPTTTEAIVES